MPIDRKAKQEKVIKTKKGTTTQDGLKSGHDNNNIRSTGFMVCIVSGFCKCSAVAACTPVLNLTSVFYICSSKIPRLDECWLDECWLDECGLNRLQFADTETQTINNCIVKQVSWSKGWESGVQVKAPVWSDRRRVKQERKRESKRKAWYSLCDGENRSTAGDGEEKKRHLLVSEKK